MPVPIANPLTLVMNIASPADYQALRELLESLQKQPPDKNPITVALNKLATVHLARFVFLGQSQLAVITTYDGPFDRYIDAFVNHIGGIFDHLLSHMKDAPPLPVSDHREEFLKYVRAHDVPTVGPLYSAYPHLAVLDILTLDKSQ